MCNEWYGQTPEDNVHVIPRNDLREHETHRDCWCRPVEQEPGVIVHNALDGREDYEQGCRLH